MNVGSSREFGSDFVRCAEEKKLLLYDTTLRDGAQTEGVTFSLQDKLSIAKKLSEFGIHYIEGGWPSSNPRDEKFFSEIKGMGLKAKICAFGMTAKVPGKDRNIDGLLKTDADVITIFGKSWDLHAKDVLKVTLPENLKMVTDTVEYLKSHGFTVFFDAEHFFDGYKANPDYALGVMDAAKEAETLVLCDTNGGTMPWEVDAITGEVRKRFKNPLGIHVHNDSGMALTSTIVAVLKGVTQVQGTINGLGERCGNLDLCEFLPVSEVKMGLKTGVDLKNLSSISRYVERMTGFSTEKNKPFVGENAFFHKGGVHIDAVLKNPKAYEHMSPELVGNTRSFSLSEQVGRAGIVNAAKSHGFMLDKSHPAVMEAMEFVKEKQTFSEAGLYVFLSKKLKGAKEPFRLLGYETKVSNDRRATTAIKVAIGNETVSETAEGVGPVHSFDVALRKALGRRFSVENVKLSNFRVRILNQEKATAASVEVFIEFRSNGDSWSMTGVSEDIIKASEEALIKGYEYYLIKNTLEGKNRG